MSSDIGCRYSRTGRRLYYDRSTGKRIAKTKISRDATVSNTCASYKKPKAATKIRLNRDLTPKSRLGARGIPSISRIRRLSVEKVGGRRQYYAHTKKHKRRIVARDYSYIKKEIIEKARKYAEPVVRKIKDGRALTAKNERALEKGIKLLKKIDGDTLHMVYTKYRELGAGHFGSEYSLGSRRSASSVRSERSTPSSAYSLGSRRSRSSVRSARSTPSSAYSLGSRRSRSSVRSQSSPSSVYDNWISRRSQSSPSSERTVSIRRASTPRPTSRKRSPYSLRSRRYQTDKGMMPLETDTRYDLRLKAKKLGITPYYNLNKKQLRARILKELRS